MTTPTNRQLDNAIPGPLVDTAAWEAARYYDESAEPHVVIGASEVPAITGLSHYQTPLEIYMVKRGLKDPDPTNAAMEWGKRLESPILDKYGDTMSCRVEPARRMVLCDDAPYIGATPDAYAWDSPVSGEGVPWLVECKTSSRWRYSDTPSDGDTFGPGEDEIPREYLLQCQAQMMVTGLWRVDVPVLFDGRDFKIYTVHRNEAIIAQLKVQLTEFYRRLCEKDPPEPDMTHPTTLNLLKDMYQPEEGVQIMLAGDMAQHAERYKEIQDEIKRLSAEKDQLQATFIAVMRDAQIAHIEGSPMVASRSVVASSHWTQKDVDTAQKNLGQVKRKGHQRFSLKETKEK